jgi:hypothetical protein
MTQTPCHVMVRAGARFFPNLLALVRLHSSLSVYPNLIVVQDAFCTRLALLQRGSSRTTEQLTHSGDIEWYDTEMPNQRPIARQI